MIPINLAAGWIGILLGFIAGAVLGLYFHDPTYLGGYASWQRRMVRLAHISFFGIGLINIAFALTGMEIAFTEATTFAWSSRLLIFSAIAMPMVCYLSAFRDQFRHLFFLPVLGLLAGVGLFLFGGVIA